MTLPLTQNRHQLTAYLDLCNSWREDAEHDDLMDADAYDRRRAERDGWQTAHWDGR